MWALPFTICILDTYYTCCIHSFIHSVFCLTTGPKPPPKRCLHIVQFRASSFIWEYPLLSLRSSSSFLRLLPRLLATSISPFIFPSVTCFRRQFLRKMWPIQLAFRFLISCRIFLCSLTLSNTSSFRLLMEEQNYNSTFVSHFQTSPPPSRHRIFFFPWLNWYRKMGVWFLSGAKHIFLPHSAETGSKFHQTSHPPMNERVKRPEPEANIHYPCSIEVKKE